MDYETKITELKNILGKIESADVPLNESMKLFENGLKLAKDCLDELDKAQSDIDALKGELDVIINKHVAE